ncbi:hypothetical protein U5A82_06225 [Sphingobium sp. CR2-8]|uniref:hypothetical protein n=1 Tax=Sphingobium sp. CR2-8 TaxID=1306534 RepID=UPI002DC02E9C|nr:hypothetical protein [Sphingobium sp. CR2-8]MEC3910085.1 hypothetical protein [Sphingobium sp. CR2-8]
MAIKDLFGFIDNKLEEVFHRPAWNAEAARKPLLKGIDNAKRQFETGQTKAPNRWWKVSNGVVALTVKVAGDTFDINGVATNHMPEDRFVEFLDKFKAAVEAGDFDDELKNKGNGDASVIIKPARKRAPMSDAAKENMRQAALRREAAKKGSAEA